MSDNPHQTLETLLEDRSAGSAASRIVRLMSASGALRPNEIARLTGLARSTVSTVMAELRDAGIVVDAEETRSRRRGVGRPSIALKLNPEAGTCVGLHLGLDEVRLVIADVAHSIIAQERVPLGRDYEPGLAAERTGAALLAAYERHGLDPERTLGIGISVSGPVAPDGTILHSSILPGWAGVNVVEVFRPVLRRPVHADNESNCAAVAEMTWGAAQGKDDFVLFKIDLGVGGAIVHGGRILTGVAGGGGEFGHVCIDPGGDLCRCGNRGCLELAASFNRPLATLSEEHGRPLGMTDVIAMAEAGDEGARASIEEVGRAAGFGLAIVGTVVNPPLIIVGGTMALAGEMILAPLRRAYEEHVLIKAASLPAARRTRIVTGEFTETDSLLGAVGLVLRDIGRLGQTERGTSR